MQFELDTDAVALLEALFCKRRSHAVTALIDVAESVLAPFPFECHVVAAMDEREVEQFAEIHFSLRRLARVFHTNLRLCVKKLSRLVRYKTAPRAFILSISS